MLPVIVGLALATGVGVARAALRARRRLLDMPPSAFGIIDTMANSSKSSKQVPFLPGGFAGTMTYAEALDILNLPATPPPTKQQLSAQHRRVMLANHPDHGGSTYMALKVNEARSVVAKHIK